MRDSKTKPPLLTSALNSIRHSLPVGGSLPEDVWRRRHRFLVGLTWFHVVIVALIGPVFGYRWDLSLAAWFDDGTVLHTIGESLVIAFFAAVAAYDRASRPFRATAVGFGLMSASAILVHLSGGYIELHFHFFVMLAFLALYQDWIPYILAIVYVAIHHGVIGVLWPEAVFNHVAAFNAPWTWAGIHAFFVLWASVGSVIAWRFNEAAFARTKLILDSAGDGIYGLDMEGKVTFINPAAIKMLGLDGGQIVGKPMEQMVRHMGKNGAAFPAGASSILTTLGDGVRQGTEEIFCRMDGTSIPVDYVSTPIFERGELIGSVVSFRDVTERQRAEQEFRALAETAKDAIVSADHGGNIIYFNGGAEHSFGYRASEVLGKPLTLLMPERFHDAPRPGFNRFPFGEETRLMGKAVEIVGKKKTGEEFPVELSLAHWKLGEETFFTGIMRDITERKKAEQALADKARELARSNTELEQFAYVASHDLQEPLRMVSSYTQLLAKRYKGNLGSDADEFIGYAVDGATRMQRLIQDLLAYSRVGTKGREFEPTDCEGVLGRVLGDLRLAIQESGAVVTHDPLPTVIADRTQLEQLFQNLIGNAIKFRNQEPPRVHVSSKQNREEWIFSIRDNGIGIDPQYAERIFVIFQRLHKRGEYPGTGIGLAVCKKIVERHGGRIWVESNGEKGTLFSFTMPTRNGTKEAS
jgi:PAS domain S-box-containing protein